MSRAGRRRALAAAGAAVLLATALILGRWFLRPSAVPAALALAPVDFAALAGWDGDDQSAALTALGRSCALIAVLPPTRSLGIAGTAADWAAPCQAVSQAPPGDAAGARRVLETWFRPWAASDRGVRDGLFTGYYETELKGARQRGGPYTVPLYRRPSDLVSVDLGAFRDGWKGQHIVGRLEGGRLVPFEDRAQIMAGALAGKATPLAWVEDPIAAFFLSIQGSGRIVLDDGSVMRVGYDGKNGRPYVSIGRVLIARGALTRQEVSMQAIRDWLKSHPGQADAVMAQNPSYVFFRELTGDGPIGAEGVALTAGRSLAVDPAFVPYGVPLWLDAQDPLDPARRVRRLVVAQDTGGAIRGPVRGDLFWGHGADAELRAGHMNSRGRYYLLLPRSLRPAG